MRKMNGLLRQPRSRVLLLVLLLAVAGGNLRIAAQSQLTLNGKAVNVERWITTQFAKGKTPPFSFEYVGTPSAQFLRTWKHTLRRLPETEESAVRYLVTYADKTTGLEVSC